MAKYRVTYSGGMWCDFLIHSLCKPVLQGKKKKKKKAFVHSMCTESKEISWKEIKMLFYCSSKHIGERICCFSPDSILKGTMSAQRYKLNLGFKQHYFVGVCLF